MLRHIGLLSVTLLSAVAITASDTAAPQPRTRQPQPSGSARLFGRVVATDDGRAVRGAQVSLSGVPDSQRDAGPNRSHILRIVETDANGRFDFPQLPAGSYLTNVNTVNRFVQLVHARETKLAKGRTVEITIRLERAGAIEGRIQDENGDAMLGAQVQAVRLTDVAGHITLAPAGAPATTNDLGGFRLFNLAGGEYYVVATFMPSQRHNEPVRRTGYADTYYPGSAALRGARKVVVRPGRTSDGVNFALAPRRLATLSIQAVDSAGVPLVRGAHVTLATRDDLYLPWSTRHASRREDGTFEFAGVPPGDYYLVVTTSGRAEEGAYVNVTTGEEDVSLRVQTNTGARVSGRVLVDGRPAGESGLVFQNVVLSAHPPPGRYGVTYARVPLAEVRGTDRFELTGLRGPMVLWAEVGGGALLSMKRAGEEIAGRTLGFAGTEVITGVVVSLTTRVAHVDVTLTRASAADDPDPVLVVLFSEDPSRWGRGYSRYERTTASSARLTRMAPGRYLIVAIQDSQVNDPASPGVLEKLRPLAVPVTLVAGQTANVTLAIRHRPRRP